MPIAAGDPVRYAALAAMLALLVGGLCLLGRLAGLGFLADLLSKPVLVGYMAGIVVIMISGQLPAHPRRRMRPVYGVRDQSRLRFGGHAGGGRCRGSDGGSKRPSSPSTADLPLAARAVIVLQLLNLVAVPLWVGQVVSGAVSISAVAILKDLLLVVLLPLAIGVAARWRYADQAKGWQPELVKIANLALGIALIAGIAATWSTIVSLFGSRSLIASLVVVRTVSLAVGYVALR